MIRRFIVTAALSLAAGCAQLRATVGEDDQARQLAGLIAYAQNVAAMRTDSQRRELFDAKQTYSKEHTPFARVRLALLLSLPGTGFADDTSAATLLEPLAATSADSPRTDALLQFAGWLHAQVAERTREQKVSAQLQEQLEAERTREQRKSAQLKEQLEAERVREQRKSTQLQEQLEAERVREQRKSAQLQEQLDALRAIERTLIDRSQGPAR